MSKERKLKKLTDKISDDNSRNSKLFEKNLDLLEYFNSRKLGSSEYLFRKLMKMHCDEEQIIKFMRKYFYYLRDNMFEWEKEIKKSLNLRQESRISGGNFVFNALKEGYGLSFIDNVLEIVNESFRYKNEKYREYVYDLFLDYTLPGTDLVYLFLENAINNNIDISNDIEKLCTMIEKYNVDLSTPDFEGKTSLTLLEDIDINNQKIMTDDQLLKLKQTIYKTSINGMLTYDKEKDLETIKSIFGDINYYDVNGSLLHYCLNHGYYFTKYINENSYITNHLNYLLELGVDPNLKDDKGRSFVDYAIEIANDSNYAFCKDLNDLPKIIEQLLKSGFEYGFDINQHPNLFLSFIIKINYVNKCNRVYNLLCLNGYKSYGFDNTYDLLYGRYQGKVLFDDIGPGIFINSYKCNRYRDWLIYLLKENNLEVTDDFEKKYNMVFCPWLLKKEYDVQPIQAYACSNILKKEIIDCTKLSESDFFNHWVSSIIKLRNENISQENNKVNLYEALNALKYLDIEKENQFSIKVKKRQQKILEYINIAKNN